MTKEEYLKELNKVFEDFKFFESDHHYEYKGQRVGMSVTRLIEEYCNEFDAEVVAEKVAEKNKKNYNYATEQLKYYGDTISLETHKELQEMLKQPTTIQEVLDEWKQKNEYACIKGSLGHEFAQTLWKTDWHHDEPFLTNSFKLANKGLINDENIKKINFQALHFYQDYKDKLEHLADEYVIGSEEYDIASAIDHLFINKLTGGLVLVDYKTNSDIHKTEKYAKNMKVPLSHLKDFTLNHYYIQLSIYRYLVEKYTNLKIEEMFIVYFSENIENYEIIEIPYLYDEVKKILENRRVKNMKSIAVLLIGGSGTGKTCSFRNMPSNETAIINVTNKPLPYKDKGQKVVSTKDYTQIISAIKGTKKRALIIDDSGYLMSFENFDKANIKSYDKFTTMAQNYYKLIEAARDLDNEKICYIVMHEEVDEDGKLKPKAIGKMLNQQLCIEGLFTIVLRYKYENGQYLIQTKTDGSSVVKSPIDLFEENEVPNDLYEIDKKIRDYYGFKQLEEKVEVEKK